MSMRWLTVLGLLAAACTPAQAFPGGSYAASCHQIHMEDGYLTALCGTGYGGYRWARIFAPRCGGSGISNQNGHLVCGGYFR